MAGKKEDKVLKERGKGHNAKDAANKKGASKLKEKNEKENTFNFTMLGIAALYAGQNINVKNFGKFDGIYFLDTVEHTVSNSGYEISLAARNSDLDRERLKDVQEYNKKNAKQTGSSNKKNSRKGRRSGNGKNNKTVYLDKNGNPIK